MKKRLRIFFDENLFNKVQGLVARMGWLRELYAFKYRPPRDENYVLRLEREMLQISKHLIFMMDIIKEERARFGIKLPNEKE